MTRLLPLLLLLACKNDNDLAVATHTDDFTQEGTDQVDVLWVVDNSVSMSEEQALVAGGFESFMAALAAEGGALDLHVGVVTTDLDRDNPDRGLLRGDPPWLTGEEADFDAQLRERVRVGTDGSDMEQGLGAAWLALTNALQGGENDGFLREDAALALVFVSDEEDCSNGGLFPADGDATLCYERQEDLVPVADFVNWFAGAPIGRGRVTASAIAGPDAAEGCRTATPGHRYASVADKLGGLFASVCEPDYSGVMDEIARQIFAPAQVFPLDHPAQADTIEVRVDDAVVAEDAATGWWYDAAYQSVRFDGDWFPPFGSEIQISYLIAY